MTATRRPCPARRRAIAAPIPVPPPVTIATRSGGVIAHSLPATSDARRPRSSSPHGAVRDAARLGGRFIGDEDVHAPGRQRAADRRSPAGAGGDRDDRRDRAEVVPADRDRSVVERPTGRPGGVEEPRVHVADRAGVAQGAQSAIADVIARARASTRRPSPRSRRGPRRNRRAAVKRRVDRRRRGAARRGRAADWTIAGAWR